MTVTAAVRTIAVSSGAAEFVWTEITELNALDISADTFRLALVPVGEAPDLGDFQDNNNFEKIDASVIRVALLVDASTVATRGEHILWARVVDVAETSIFPASGTILLI